MRTLILGLACVAGLALTSGSAKAGGFDVVVKFGYPYYSTYYPYSVYPSYPSIYSPTYVPYYPSIYTPRPIVVAPVIRYPSFYPTFPNHGHHHNHNHGHHHHRR